MSGNPKIPLILLSSCHTVIFIPHVERSLTSLTFPNNLQYNPSVLPMENKYY